MDVRCQRCQRLLTDKKSIRRGIGPRCFKKVLKALHLDESSIHTKGDLQKIVKKKYGIEDDLFRERKA